MHTPIKNKQKNLSYLDYPNRKRCESAFLSDHLIWRGIARCKLEVRSFKQFIWFDHRNVFLQWGHLSTNLIWKKKKIENESSNPQKLVENKGFLEYDLDCMTRREKKIKKRDAIYGDIDAIGSNTDAAEKVEGFAAGIVEANEIWGIWDRCVFVVEKNSVFCFFFSLRHGKKSFSWIKLQKLVWEKREP